MWTATRPITAVVADAHDGVRSALRCVLEGEADIAVVAEAADLPLARQHLLGHRPDVLVLDPRVSYESSAAAIRSLRAADPHVRIVVVSGDAGLEFASWMLMSGASAFVLKERADEELPDAVRHAAHGERFIGLGLSERSARRRGAKPHAEALAPA